MMCMHVQDGDQCPWLFLTSPQHDAGVYGYRSVILETVYPSHVITDDAPAAAAAVEDDADAGDDNVGPVQCVCAADETMFTTLTCSSGDDDDDNDNDDNDDFHRRYRPYHRLVDASRDHCWVEAVALRLGRSDDMTLVRRRFRRKSSIGDLPSPSIDDIDL